MKTYKDFIIMTDMDGTLIGSNNCVSAKNQAAIRYFTEQGGSFGVATGRTQKNCAPYMRNLTINTPCIFYNGAALFDWSNQVFMQTCQLEVAVMADFVRACMAKCPQLCVQIYTETELFVISAPGNHDPVMLAERQEFIHTDLAAISNLPWFKVLLCDEQANLLACQQLACQYKLKEQTNSFFSSPVYFEFVAKRVSKGHMLTELMRLAPYQGKFVVAAGDFPNDIEMLKRADCGIAPANAQPEVKAIADLIGVSCDEDLLADIIYRVIPKLF